MTAIELKEEIDKRLDSVSEKTLEDILAYIKKKQDLIDINKDLEYIMKEDDNLLRRLAK